MQGIYLATAIYLSLWWKILPLPSRFFIQSTFSPSFPQASFPRLLHSLLEYRPDAPQNKDQNGLIFLNTGFIIAQRSHRTREMFEAWEACAERYKGCPWRNEAWPRELTAFGAYFRYNLNKHDDVILFPVTRRMGALRRRS